VQNASCAIFSKKASIEIDKHYMDFKGAGDWFFWINIAEKGNVCFACEICNSYRLHSNTTSKVVKSGLEFREMNTIYEWLFDNAYLTQKQFQRCKTNNLALISSLSEIPYGVKKELYRMWGASYKQLIMCWCKIIKSLLKNTFQ
jgi:hypothetical protein